jgi:DNA-binding transcriptional ArsR family regulator
MHGRRHERPTPDVFTPPPPSPAPAIDEELAALRATPPATVRAQLAKHYLATLRAAGLVERHRAGTSVLYARTPDATSLLRLLAPAAIGG